MAQITTAPSEKKAGVRKVKKLFTRVDLTPMVDLGSLLITFFIFTTSMSLPRAIDLYMPAGDTRTTQLGESSALTVILLGEGKIFYYHGEWSKALQKNLYGTTSYSQQEGIGHVIRQKQSALDKIGIGRKELMLIIKPGPSSIFRNSIDILDEVLINMVRHYAFIDIREEEKALLNRSTIHL